MRKRKWESILRTKRYNMSKECEKYFHRQLLLYGPGCSECELKGFSTYEEHYESVKDVVDHNVRYFKQHSKYLKNVFDHLKVCGMPWHQQLKRIMLPQGMKVSMQYGI